MSRKKITYSGNSLLGVNFGLYNYNEPLDFERSKESIKEAFAERYKKTLKDFFKEIGLKFCGFSYYSPRAYNFSTDSLDVILRVQNKNKLKKYILKYKDKIDCALALNYSYDGYISRTVANVATELENLKEKDKSEYYRLYEPWQYAEYGPDILVLKTIISQYLDFSDFKVADYFKYDLSYHYEEIEELKDKMAKTMDEDEKDELDWRIQYLETEAHDYELLEEFGRFGDE